MSLTRPALVDYQPQPVICRGYQGDPFDWAIAVILDNGDMADLDGWEWAAWIDAGDGIVIPWICTPEPHGVALYLRGADTLRLPPEYSPFDVTGRDPRAGEGRTIVAGQIIVAPRVTPPLRGMSAAEPAPSLEGV